MVDHCTFLYHVDLQTDALYTVLQCLLMSYLFVKLRQNLSVFAKEPQHICPKIEFCFISIFLVKVGLNVYMHNIVSDIAVFVLKRDVKLQPTNLTCIISESGCYPKTSKSFPPNMLSVW